MKPKEYLILSECIERGINRGYDRAFKYNEKPSEWYIKEYCYKEAMSEVDDYFNFPDVGPITIHP